MLLTDILLKNANFMFVYSETPFLPLKTKGVELYMYSCLQYAFRYILKKAHNKHSLLCVTHQSILGPRGGLWPILLVGNP
jgi:hypothetical protein